MKKIIKAKNEEMQILHYREIEEEVPSGFDDYLGVIYVAVFSNGLCKIGRTKQPRLHLKTLYNNAGHQISEVFISKPCTNYVNIETCVKQAFKRYLFISDLYKADFKTIIRELKAANYVDERTRLKRDEEKRISNAEAFVASMFRVEEA